MRPSSSFRYSSVASLKAARDSAYYGSRFSRVVDFSVKDERTLEISLEQPYENLPLQLDVPIVKAGTQKEERPIGTGPYAFSEELTGLCLRRNQSWWQENRAPVEYDTILLTAAANPTEVRDSFELRILTLPTLWATAVITSCGTAPPPPCNIWASI